jgi:hypothetical protein
MHAVFDCEDCMHVELHSSSTTQGLSALHMTCASEHPALVQRAASLTCLSVMRAASVASASFVSCSLLMLSTMSVYLLSALALQAATCKHVCEVVSTTGSSNLRG